MTKNRPTPEQGTTIPVARISEKRASCIEVRDQFRLQLAGIENQIYVLDQLLDPEPPPETATEASATPPGTI